MNKKIKIGMILALLTATISGVSIFYNKLVLVKGVDPLIFNILKNGGVAVLLSVLLIQRKKISVLRTLTKQQWMKLGIIAVVGGSIPFILYFDALRNVSAINASLIHKSLFIWVAMLAIPLLGERLSPIQVIGYAVIAWSNLFIGGFSGFTWSRPEMMIIAATMLWSIENVVAKFALKDIENSVVAWARMFFGSIILIGIATFQGKLGLFLNLTAPQLLATGGSILLLTAYVTSWYKALSLAPATLVTAILILATPITNILSAIFITHTVPTAQIVNLVGTSIGLLCITILARAFSRKPQEQSTPLV